jgi:hypothetical protein
MHTMEYYPALKKEWKFDTWKKLEDITLGEIILTVYSSLLWGTKNNQTHWDTDVTG